MKCDAHHESEPAPQGIGEIPANALPVTPKDQG
jgi:hypothetical protein